MAAAGKNRAAGRGGGRRGASGGGHNTYTFSAASVSDTDNGAAFFHQHLPECEPVCILKQLADAEWRFITYNGDSAAAAQCAGPLSESAVPAAELPDPDYDDTEP